MMKRGAILLIISIMLFHFVLAQTGSIIRIYDVIQPNTPKVLSIFDEDYGLTRVGLTLLNKGQDVKFIISKYSGSPIGIEPLKSNNIDKYFKIQIDNVEDNIEKLELGFKVDKNWIKDNSIDQNEISLYILNNNSWEEIQSKLAGEDKSNFLYSAETKKEGLFLIAERIDTAIPLDESNPPSLVNGTVVEKSFAQKYSLKIIIILIIILCIFIYLKKMNNFIQKVKISPSGSKSIKVH